EGREEVHPHDLGLSERKWVAMASALAGEPSVVVLDEPTLGQDYPSRQRLRELVKRLGAEGKTVLVVTHDMDFVGEACATTVVLEHFLVVAVHLRAVRVLAVDVLALEDDAEPDLVGVLGGPEHRVVDPAVWRVVLELGHLLHERVGVSWLELIPGDRSEHHSFTSTSEQGGTA